VERKEGVRQTTVRTLDVEPDSFDLEMQVRLAGGIGVSVINAVPEELVYGALEQIEVWFISLKQCKTTS
jgi:vacuolar protein sorting-associated protein 13D